MKELSNEMVYIFSRLSGFEQGIFIFWGVCLTAFIISYSIGVFQIIKNFLSSKKSKPTTF
jgi:hypothetical protein